MDQCINCKHLNAFSGGCLAYPDEIPFKFTNGEEKHDKVENDQKGDYIFAEGESHELEELNNEK